MLLPIWNLYSGHENRLGNRPSELVSSSCPSESEEVGVLVLESPTQKAVTPFPPPPGVAVDAQTVKPNVFLRPVKTLHQSPLLGTG